MNIQDERKAFDNIQNEIQSWISVRSFAVEDANPDKPIIDANEVSEFIGAVFKKLEGCVVVSKKDTEDWYLDPDEYMWFDHDGIDSTLCDMNIGEVTAIEHKEYLITVSDTIYAAKVWDSENEDVGFWEFFKTEAEAEKAAVHCKAMIEAARGGNE